MKQYAAFGTILAYGNNESPSEEFTRVAQVRDIGGPSMSRETIDVTHHASPGMVAEFLASLADGGEVTFDVLLDPGDASHDQTTGLMALMGETQPRNWRLITPAESETPDQYYGYGFRALVTGFKPGAPVKEALTASITLKVAGQVTQSTYAVTGLC